MTEPRPRTPFIEQADVLILAGLLAMGWSVYLSLANQYVLDCDVAHLALGIERFDVREHQPHPPGYLGYVLVLRALRALTGMEILPVTHFASRIFASLTVIFTWWAGRRAAPDEPAIARWAAALAATNPIVLYYGVDGQTHSAEAAMAAALLVLLARRPERPTLGFAAALGALIAVGGSFRPSYALVAVIPAAWALGFRVAHLAVAAFVGTAVTVAWLVPTAALSGGWEMYQRVSDALIGNFVRITSPLSKSHEEHWANINIRNALWWSVVAAMGAVVARVAALIARVSRDETQRWLGRLYWLMVIPAVAFFTLILCAEAGYLAGLVPIAALCAAAWCGSRGPRALRHVLVGLMTAQLVFFALAPQGVCRTFMMPTVQEILTRQVLIATYDDRIHENTPEDAHILVASDYPDLALRQLPILHPNLDVIFLHSKKRFALGDRSSISLATNHGWHFVPGGYVNGSGDDHTLFTPHAYDVVVIDPRSSEDFYDLIRAQANGCPVEEPTDRMTAAHLPARCFTGERLLVGDGKEDFVFGWNLPYPLDIDSGIWPNPAAM
jgi:hypothetical protein